MAYTHAHADHLFGLDDLRIFPRYLGHELPIYCEKEVEERSAGRSPTPSIRPCTAYPAGGVPKLVFRRIDAEPFEVLGAEVMPIRLVHGRYAVLGLPGGQRGLLHRHQADPAGKHGLCWRPRRADPRRACATSRTSTHLNFDEAVDDRAAMAPETDAVHPHLAPPGARGHQPHAARRHGIGVRWVAVSAEAY